MFEEIPIGLQSWGVLVLAWIIERLYPISSSVDPIAFFRFVCDRMAKQVLPAPQQSQQHFISGSLALIVLISPIILIVYLVLAFSSYQWVLDALILYLALQFRREAKTSKQVKAALQNNKNQLAKDILSQSVLRDTAPLSSMGIAKACIEMYVLRCVYQQMVVMFWFILLGPSAALAYRLIYEANQSWNTKLKRFVRFAWFASKLTFVMQWLPARLFALIMSILSVSRTGLKPLFLFFSPMYILKSNGAIILYSSKAIIDRTLSGAVMYEGKKVRRMKFLALSEPSANDIDAIKQACLLSSLVFMCVLLILSWGLYA